MKRVIVPGGYWREFDYGGAGWLARRTVQTGENSSETTLYSYDAWGRLRGIDYPRSADVRMGWDGENRRVWVEDGAGRRDYVYDAWGRVREQRGCCGSGEGIEVVAVAAEYDPAGRKRSEKELRADNSVVRTIESTYDALGRLQSIGDYRGTVVYRYDAGGRLRKEEYWRGQPFPEGTPYLSVCLTYYGSEEPSQRGFLKEIAFGFGDCDTEGWTPAYSVSYQYDLLGRATWSRETPSGDELRWAYTPVGRVEYEARTGDLGYYRVYAYNTDGSRAWVLREDLMHGFSLDVYHYELASGRLAQVEGSTGVHRFRWSALGRLVRWEAPEAEYARVYSYDEEGRLLQIARENDTGNVHLVYEARYNGDGFRVWDREWRWEVMNPPLTMEYKYVCQVGCGRMPLRVYRNEGGFWVSYEWYVRLWRSVWYDGYEGIETPLTWRNLDYPIMGGRLLWAEVPYPPFLVQLAFDWFGVFVGNRFYPQKVKRWPKDLLPHPDMPPPVYLPQPSVPPIERNPEIPNPWFPKKPKPVGPIIDFCNGALKGNDVYAARERCENWFKTEEGSEWLEQCMEHDPRCSASMDPYKCCLWKCMTAAGAGPGEAAEAVECFLKGYGGVWRGL
ncbi:MAG: hypothetical protein KatS3mg017_0027 [Fimbriimonadales bacterium]|nr:MAG: hypothetical protein KatS3mg017_0027 [Fimbriimonadales bacterium]